MNDLELALEDRARAEERLRKVIEELKPAMLLHISEMAIDHDLSPREVHDAVLARLKANARATRKIDVVSPQLGETRPAKYRDPVSGAMWAGCGKEPNWIRDSGKDREAFRILEPEE